MFGIPLIGTTRVGIRIEVQVWHLPTGWCQLAVYELTNISRGCCSLFRRKASSWRYDEDLLIVSSEFHVLITQLVGTRSLARIPEPMGSKHKSFLFPA